MSQAVYYIQNLSGKIRQNLVKLSLLKVKKPCNVSYQNLEFWAGFTPFFTQK